MFFLILFFLLELYVTIDLIGENEKKIIFSGIKRERERCANKTIYMVQTSVDIQYRLIPCYVMQVY